MKKVIVLILCAALALGCALPAAAVPREAGLENFQRLQSYSDGQYTDVNEDLWYGANKEGTVKAAYEYGLMVGDGASFAPGGPVTVAQAVAMAARLHSIYNSGEAVFDETSGESWYDCYYEYCVSHGILAQGELSDANAKATRAQYGALIAKALPDEALKAVNTVESGAITDVPAEDKGGEYAYRLFRAGILEGREAGKFDPDGGITRAEAAAAAVRVADPTLRRSFTLTLSTPTPEPTQTPAPTPEPTEKPDTTLKDTVLLARQAADAAQKQLAAAKESYQLYALSPAPQPGATDMRVVYLAAARQYLASATEMAETCAMHSQNASKLADGDVKKSIDNGFNNVMASVEYIKLMYQAMSAAAPAWKTDAETSASYYLNDAVLYLAQAYTTLTK